MGDGTLVIMGEGKDAQLALVDFGECRTKSKVARNDAMKYLVTTIDTISKARKLSVPFLDHLFITHPHKDHYNAILKLINETYPSFKGKTLNINGLTYGGAKHLYNQGKSAKTNLIDLISPHVKGKTDELDSLWHSDVDSMDSSVDPSWRFVDSEVKVYLLCSNYPTIDVKKDYNTLSLCLMFEDLHGHKVILMGDAGENVEKEIITTFKDVPGFLNAYGLKLGHHASKTSTSNKWLAAVNPKAVFASGDMVWAHPYCEPLDRADKHGTLAAVGAHWFCCGTSDDKEYFNHESKLQIFLNLWYVVKLPSQKMTDFDGKSIVAKKGVTFGVQWELKFDGPGDPTVKLTDTFSPSSASN